MACQQTSYRQKLKADPEVLFFCLHDCPGYPQGLPRVIHWNMSLPCTGVYSSRQLFLCANPTVAQQLWAPAVWGKSWGLTCTMKSCSALFPWFHLYCTRAHNALCVAASRLPQVRLCWKAAHKPECDSVLKVKGPFPKGRLFQSFLQNWIRF